MDNKPSDKGHAQMSSLNNGSSSGFTGNALRHPSASNQSQGGASAGALNEQQTQPTTQHQQRYGCSTIPCLERWKGEAPNLEPFTQFSLKEVSAQPDGKRGEVIDRSDTGRRGDDILGSPEMFPFDNKAAQIEGSSGPSKQLQHGLPETLRVNGHRIQKASGSTK